MEDVSEESQIKFKEHLQKVVDDFYSTRKSKNPWLEEIWRHRSNCSDNQHLDGKDCGITSVGDNFYVDSKVTNVMDAAVIFHHSIMKYIEEKCNANGRTSDCIHEKFDGTKFFKKVIMKKAKNLQHLFGDGNSRRINLSSCGDSTPKYAIYQYQASTLSYGVIQNNIFLFFILNRFVDLENWNLVW